MALAPWFVQPSPTMECEACGHSNVEGARFCANCGGTITLRSDDKNPLIGTVVGGRYRITGVIGQGGMGIVYEAEQQMGSTVRKVAVKTLHAELSRDPSVTQRFHRECGTVAQLEHPNTIKVYDFGAMDDGTLYIAMEYLAGEPLDRVIAREGALHPERALHLLRQIGGSLGEAHRQGIIHRDLKPENVILVERAGTKDVVKLLDFGIAARTESADAAREAKLTQQGMVLGTPPYMSPEQFTGKALDIRSDIYSLGVMAYEMVTGQLPFDANTPWEWATEHMTAQPRPFETMPVSAAIPAGMRSAILKALSKDREARFDSVAGFIDALALGLAGQQTTEPVGETGTAMMEAAPNFAPAGAGPAPTAAMPAKADRSTAAAAAISAAPAPSRQAGGRPLGLVLGLGGLAVVLLGGIGYATMGGGSSSELDESEVFALPTAAPSASAVEPTPSDSTPTPTAEDTPPDAEEPSVPVVSPPITKPTPPKPKPTPPKPKPTPPKADPPKADPPKADPKPSEPSAACQACISQANAGNLSAAAQSYAACSDAAAKRDCQSRARRRAGSAAVDAVNSGNCAQARQILAAANAMGAGSPNLSRKVGECK